MDRPSYANASRRVVPIPRSKFWAEPDDVSKHDDPGRGRRSRVCRLADRLPTSAGSGVGSGPPASTLRPPDLGRVDPVLLSDRPDALPDAWQGRPSSVLVGREPRSRLGPGPPDMAQARPQHRP